MLKRHRFLRHDNEIGYLLAGAQEAPRHPPPERCEAPKSRSIDHIRHEASASVDQRDGSIVGVGRYVHVADRRGVVEVAVEVAAELQNLGIGTALAWHTVQRARANGFALLTATTLRENRPARALLQRFELRAGERRQEIELELKLDPLSDCPEHAGHRTYTPRTNP